MSQLHVLHSPFSDCFVWDGRAAHRDHPWSDQKRVWHRDAPWTTTGGLPGDYPPWGLFHWYNRQTFLSPWIWCGRNYSSQLHTVPVLIFLIAYNVDTLDRTVGERRHVVTVELAVRPVDFSAAGSCELAFTEKVVGQLPQEMKDAVENGVNSSYLQGNIGLTNLLSFLKPLKSKSQISYISSLTLNIHY